MKHPTPMLPTQMIRPHPLILPQVPTNNDRPLFPSPSRQPIAQPVEVVPDHGRAFADGDEHSVAATGDGAVAVEVGAHIFGNRVVSDGWDGSREADFEVREAVCL